MRGAQYAIAEIVLWMLAAGVVGAVIGWMLRGWSRAQAAAEWKAIALKERARSIELEAEHDQPAGETPTAPADPFEGSSSSTVDTSDGEPIDPAANN